MVIVCDLWKTLPLLALTCHCRLPLAMRMGSPPDLLFVTHVWELLADNWVVVLAGVSAVFTTT